MDLAIISTVRGYRWAGSEEVWYGAARKALENGDRITAYIHEDFKSAEQIAELVKKGGKISTRRSFPYARLSPIKEKLLPSFPVKNLNQADIILVSLGGWGDLFYVSGLREALLQIKKPYVLFCQFNAECLPLAPWQRVELRKIIEKSAGCCFVSQQNLDLTQRQLAMRCPAAQVLGNPIRIERPNSLPWPSNGSIRMACVARFDTLWKGQDLLLEILSHPQWATRKWQLSFFGEGPDSDHLKNAVKYYGLEDRVQFQGYVRDLESIWQNHHLLVLPSRGEGLPLAILEAMMCGRPILATDVGGNREILTDGVTGFIAEAATPYSLGKTMDRAWNEQSRWVEMGQEAHRRAKAMSSTEPTALLLRYLAQRIALESPLHANA